MKIETFLSNCTSRYRKLTLHQFSIERCHLFKSRFLLHSRRRHPSQSIKHLLKPGYLLSDEKQLRWGVSKTDEKMEEITLEQKPQQTAEGQARAASRASDAVSLV